MNAAVEVKTYKLNKNNFKFFPKHEGKVEIGKTKYRKALKTNGVRVARAAQPFTKEQVRLVSDYFLKGKHKTSFRNYMMCVMGFNTGRRISDILAFKVYDVYDYERQQVVDGVWIREKKTGNQIYIPFNNYVKDAIELYLLNLPQININDYLFYSPKMNDEGEYRLGTKQAWYIINKTKKALNLNVSGGTHILRKTFGANVYHSNPTNEALQTLQEMFGHASQRDTLRYIGSLEENRKDIMLNLEW